MKFLIALRHTEWWEYKLPPLLGVAYATLILLNQNIFEQGIYILLALISLIVGASYVSIINDITDIDDDAKAGKLNRMAKLPLLFKIILPAACLFLGILFLVILYWPNYLSCLCYTIPWIAFTLYSFKPVRLKNRGIAGVLADASGSHIFTSLLMVAYMSFITNNTVNFIWLFSIAIWASCYGIRGILWHQFHDRENDIRSKVETFATKIAPRNFKKIELLIFIVELSSILGILLIINNILTYIALILYILLVLLRFKKLNLYPIIILERSKQYQILMLDFMQVFFPIALLLYATFTQTNAWIILIIHLTLFPIKTICVVKDIKKVIFS